MNKQSVSSIVVFFLASSIALALVLSVQIPILLTGGSDSLEVIVKVSNLSQWIALSLLILNYLFCFILNRFKNKINSNAKIISTLITLIIFLMSGYSFRYSGKQHMLVNSLFFVPIQNLAINPTQNIDNAKVEKRAFSFGIYSGDTKLFNVWLGVPPWRLNENKVSNVLDSFVLQ